MPFSKDQCPLAEIAKIKHSDYITLFVFAWQYVNYGKTKVNHPARGCFFQADLIVQQLNLFKISNIKKDPF